MNRWPQLLAARNVARLGARLLLVLLVLAAVAGVTQRYAPRLPVADAPPIAALALSSAPPRIRYDSLRTDTTIALLKSIEPVKAPTLSKSAYRRSAQIEAAIRQLRARGLMVPVAGITMTDLKDSFNDWRSERTRRHNAIDIPAPAGTPVLAVEDGEVLRMKNTGRGGISVFASDSSGQFIFFYAHLLDYHPGLQEGQRLLRGDTIGYVGTTGNAPRDRPHLHFSILLSSSLARWSTGTPINPAEIWRK